MFHLDADVLYVALRYATYLDVVFPALVLAVPVLTDLLIVLVLLVIDIVAAIVDRVPLRSRSEAVLQELRLAQPKLKPLACTLPVAQVRSLLWYLDRRREESEVLPPSQ